VSRIRSLDGWRAVGVTLVLVSHAPFTTGFPARYADSVRMVFDGELGVRLFFVLSGFLITYLLLGEAARSGSISLPRFYARRSLRILPIYVTYLLVLALLAALGLYHDSWSSWFGALTFTRNLFGIGRSATVQLWSLAIEEQFYLLWPMTLAAFALWSRPRAFVAVVIAAMIACPVLRATLMSSSPGGSLVNRLLGQQSALMYVDSLMVGCLGALIVRARPAVPPALESPVLPVLAIATVAAGQVIQLERPPDSWPVALVPGIQALAMMFLIWASAFQRPGMLSRGLNLRPVVLLGTLSYSLYVWQFLFISHFVPALSGSWTHDWKWWMICAVAVAAVSYYGVERPFLELKTRFAPPASPRQSSRSETNEGHESRYA
jgi:peptidoglycan/LPS O-acetylase OafA/YrhL